MEIHGNRLFLILIISSLIVAWIIVYLLLRKGQISENVRLKISLSAGFLSFFASYALLFLLMTTFLPQYFIIDGTEYDNCRRTYVLNTKIFSEMSRKFIINNTSDTLYIMCQTYGDVTLDKEDEEIKVILPHSHTRYDKHIDEYFRGFPDDIIGDSQEAGKVERHLLTREQLEEEIYKIMNPTPVPEEIRRIFMPK